MKSNSLEKVRSSWIARHRPESESTDWGQSLAMYGLLRSLDVSYDQATYDFLRRWIYFHLNESVNVNYFCGSWSFGLLYPEMEKYFPEVQLQLRATAEEIYDFIIHKALRNGNGVILHNIDLPNIYIDTVYYSSVVLAKLGTYLKCDWKKEAIDQLQKHLAILKDGTKPFYIHCEENLGGQRSEGSWARGNGWVMMTCAELLLMFNANSKAFALISNEIFIPLSLALEKEQTKSGLWRTILDDPSAYEETSASAMYLFALKRGRKLGVLPKRFDKVIENTANALSKHIDKKGKFTGVSEGTWPGTIEYYKSLDRGEWWWGAGAYLLAIAEVIDVSANKHIPLSQQK